MTGKVTEKEMLDLLAERAPAPSAGYADHLLRRARRARAGRRALAGAAGAAAVVVCSIASLALAGSGSGSAPTGPVVVPATTAPVPSDRALAYAAAIKAVADEGRGGTGPPVKGLYVMDRLCPDPAAAPPPTRCAGAPLAERLRADLALVLKPYAPVTFIADGRTVTGDLKAAVVDDWVVITLGPARFDATTARISVSMRRGPLNGRGMTYQLTRHDGHWKVSGASGPAWIT